MSKVPRLTVKLSDDEQVAYLTVIAGDPASAEALDRCLVDSHITAGIDSAVYAEVVSQLTDPTYAVSELTIAQGRAVVQGKDAYFENVFPIGIQAGHVRDDGSLDYHDRELLKRATADSVLGVLHDAVPGEPGMRLDGTLTQPTSAKPSNLKLLDGVRLYPDGTLRATRDGVVLYKAGQSIDVVDQLVHQGPVDLHSGNLNMQGSLTIRGDVVRPFTVTTTGDLEIFGSIQSSSVHSGGHLHVHGGIRGAEGCTVSAEGDLAAKHGESAKVYAGGLLTVQEAVNTELSAVRVYVRGRVRGGKLVAEERLDVAEAGASSGTATHLLAGEPVTLPLIDAQRQIAQSKAQRLSLRARGRSEERDKGGKSGRAKAQLATEEVERLAQRTAHREHLSGIAQIEIALAHAGVTVQINEAQLTLGEAVRSTRFRFDPIARSLRQEKIDR